jgi:CTP synthase (UTP-ammonia lyase)
MTKYDERIDPYASLTNSLEPTHMSERAKSKLSNILSSMFDDNSHNETKDEGFK